MKAAAHYVLDANVFIEAKRRYYAFDLCPGFWEALLAHHRADHLCSADCILGELRDGHDDLAAWVKGPAPAGFWKPTKSPAVVEWYGKLMAWSQAQSQYLPQAKAEFAASADAWLVALAKEQGWTVVTHEVLDPNIRKKIPIPNVCNAFGVVWADTFGMLRALGARFFWEEEPGNGP